MDTTALSNAAKKSALNNKEIVSPSMRASNFLSKYAPQIAKALGNAIAPEQFIQSIVNAVAVDPNLIKAVTESPASFIGAILQSAQLGFIPNSPLGLAYLIAYFQKNKVKSKEKGRDVYEMRVSFQLGYQGVLTLAYRSKEISYVNAEAVYDKDFFDYQLGSDPYIKHKPYEGSDRGKIIKYYAVVKLKDGGVPLFKVWTAEQVMQHAQKFSKSYSKEKGCFYGCWNDNFESMAKKTVLLDCLRYAPKSASLAVGIASDNTTKSVSNNNDIIDVNVLMQKNEDFNEYELGQAIDGDNPKQLDMESDIPQNGDTQETIGAIREKFRLGSGSSLKNPKKKIVGEMDPGDVI